jgi:hypothetical protein
VHWPSQRRETHVKGKSVRPEVEALENMRLAFFDDLAAPAEDELGAPEYVQMGLETSVEVEGATEIESAEPGDERWRKKAETGLNDFNFSPWKADAKSGHCVQTQVARWARRSKP